MVVAIPLMTLAVRTSLMPARILAARNAILIRQAVRNTMRQFRNPSNNRKPNGLVLFVKESKEAGVRISISALPIVLQIASLYGVNRVLKGLLLPSYPAWSVLAACSACFLNTLYTTLMFRWTTAASRNDPTSAVHLMSVEARRQADRGNIGFSTISAVFNVLALSIWEALPLPFLYYLNWSTLLGIIESRLLYSPGNFLYQWIQSTVQLREETSKRPATIGFLKK